MQASGCWRCCAPKPQCPDRSRSAPALLGGESAPGTLRVMSNPTLVFSHANSYPAGCYRLLFDAWRDAGWRVEALPQFGHHPAHPVTPAWSHLVDELLGFIDERVGSEAPVALVGHSLGGLLSLMAAVRRPRQARAVVQLDSPFIRGWRAALVRFGHFGGRKGLGHRIPPAAIAQQRREHWPDRAQLEAHFRNKPLFQAWDPRVLDDYLREGFEPDPERGGWRLRFRREVEARIYATLPHNLSAQVRRLQAPLGFVAGTHSREMRQGGVLATRALVGPAHWREVEGTHLFPFEQPEPTAATVLELLAGLAR